MRIALISPNLDPEKPDTHLRALAHWTEQMHAGHELLLFPRIDLPDPGKLVQATDALSALSRKRHARIATVLNTARNDHKQQTVILAERNGQIDARSHILPAESNNMHSAAPLVTTTIEGLHVGLTNAESLMTSTLRADAQLARLHILCVPLRFAGEPDETGRINADRSPRRLAELIETLAEIAREMQLVLIASNSIGPDTPEKCGPCGGAWVYGPDGLRLAEIPILQEKSVTFTFDGDL
ncbi:MAG: hypothetical protein ACOC29_00500 [Candidatus Sumerlaeota bacterium]